ncbi:MAG: hypothetical protein QXO75_04645 [Nitrososphaerota archaeon]
MTTQLPSSEPCSCPEWYRQIIYTGEGFVEKTCRSCGRNWLEGRGSQYIHGILRLIVTRKFKKGEDISVNELAHQLGSDWRTVHKALLYICDRGIEICVDGSGKVTKGAIKRNVFHVDEPSSATAHVACPKCETTFPIDIGHVKLCPECGFPNIVPTASIQVKPDMIDFSYVLSHALAIMVFTFLVHFALRCITWCRNDSSF